MSKNFKSLKEFQEYLNKQLIIAMDKVGETALQEMIEHVQSKLGDDDSNKFYKQTGEFLESIQRISAELKPDGSVQTIIYYNTDEITPYLVGVNPPVESSQTWNWHADIYGRDISELLPYWLDVTGTYGDSFYDREPIGALKYMREEWIIKHFRNELKKELNRLGIPTK